LFHLIVLLPLLTQGIENYTVLLTKEPVFGSRLWIGCLLVWSRILLIDMKVSYTRYHSLTTNDTVTCHFLVEKVKDRDTSDYHPISLRINKIEMPVEAKASDTLHLECADDNFILLVHPLVSSRPFYIRDKGHDLILERLLANQNIVACLVLQVESLGS
jgi:hypothetical protein